MGLHIELRDDSGRARTGLADPSGGTFDAAGDFDRIIDEVTGEPSADLPILRSLDPYGETRLSRELMDRVIAECTLALTVARDGPERRGLLRLRALAEQCSHLPGSALFCIGD